MFAYGTIFSALVLSWVTYYLAKTVWSVYCGSLSSVPGPKLAAATRLVLISHKARGDAETWRLALHQIYGDVVRIAPNEVSFASGKAWREIYGSTLSPGVLKYGKDQTFYGQQSKEPSLVVANDSDHSRMRKCFSHAFSERALREQEPMIQHYISQLVTNLEQVAKAPEHKVNLAGQYNFATFDIMADLAFGRSLDCLVKSEFNSWVATIFASVQMITIITELNHYPLMKRLLDLLIPPSIREKQKQHQQFSADRVDNRLNEETSRFDLWHYVIAAEEKNIRLTRGEMHENAGLFMIAGSETSATLLSGLTYYLLKNPAKKRLVLQEIREKFSSPEQIGAQSVLSLEYLTACIMEAFRLHPPVPIGLPRIVPAGGTEICGYKLPGSTCVYIHQFSTYRNPNNFVHSDQYLPERWLTKDQITKLSNRAKVVSDYDLAEFSRDDKLCLQPFSIGPRNCIGQGLAWLELRLLITRILWQFDLEICEESLAWDDQRVFSLWDTKPLMVSVKSAPR